MKIVIESSKMTLGLYNKNLSIKILIYIKIIIKNVAKISKTSVLELQVFQLWNPIFTKIHHGEIFRVDDYKYSPEYFSLGGIL